jgi:hypothetical protein
VEKTYFIETKPEITEMMELTDIVFNTITISTLKSLQENND